MNKPLCIIAGAGPGNGNAFCNKFHKEGYRVVLLARNLDNLHEIAGQRADIYSYACDLSDPDSIREVFTTVLSEQGVPDVVIYNAGSGLFAPPLETSLEDFETAWRINALGLLCVAGLVTPPMIENGGGSLLITGATASLRGGANFAAFSSAKAAQRNLAQSLARSLGSQGIHVSLVIIDGVIDLPRSREKYPNMPDSSLMQPEAIADNYFHLATQSHSAWTFELDLRNKLESW